VNDPRLERYLGTLENSLRAFPVGDRADIITEIRSHVLSALERDPSARLDTILAALGEPEMVANRYLLERGLKPTKPPISPIVKWLVIGFLATFAMMLIFVTYLIIWLSPKVRHDGSFKFMNGAFKYDSKKDQFSLAGLTKGDDFGGSINATEKMMILFESGNFDVATSDSKEMTWSCSGVGSAPNPKTVNDQTTLDFSELKSIRCQIGIPKSSRLTIKGETGKISLENPLFHVVAQLDAGKIDFDGDDKAVYKIHANVHTGKADEFKSSDALDAFLIDMQVDRGVISNEK
jgi:hypothetical protein